MDEVTKKQEQNTREEVKKSSTSSSGHPLEGKVKRPKKNRLPFEGGRDGPLRNGLSGTVRKYLRLLHQAGSSAPIPEGYTYGEAEQKWHDFSNKSVQI